MRAGLVPGTNARRAPATPTRRPREAAAAEAVLALQRAAGNTAVGVLLQRRHHQHALPQHLWRLRMRAFTRASRGVATLRTDTAPEGRTPRADVSMYLEELLAQDKTLGPKVGHAILSATSGLQLLVGERGAHDVDTLFKDPEIRELLLRPIDDRQAMEQIATRERTYWDATHLKSPSPGTRAARKLNVADRVVLQQWLGDMLYRAQEYQKKEDPGTDYAG
jgi:hypothetical protein